MMHILDIEEIVRDCRASGECDEDHRTRGETMSRLVLDALVSIVGERLESITAIWDVKNSMILYIAAMSSHGDGASIALVRDNIPCATMAFQGFAKLCAERGIPCALTIDYEG